MKLIDGTNGTLLPGTSGAFADESQRFADMSAPEWQGFSAAACRTATAYSWQDAADRLIEVFATEASVITPLHACGQGAR